MPKAVIFDVDGTLIDTVALHARAWEDKFRHFGHEVPADRIHGQIGKGADQLMPVFVGRAEVAKHGKEMERFRADRFRESYLPRARAFPGVRELFERIRAQDSAIALASCKPEELDSYMELAGIPDLVYAKTTSDDADRSKPEPDILEAALHRLGGVAAGDAVMVGDESLRRRGSTKRRDWLWDC